MGQMIMMKETTIKNNREQEKLLAEQKRLTAELKRKNEELKRKNEELAALKDLLQEKMLGAQSYNAMKKQSCDLKNEVHNLKVLNKKLKNAKSVDVSSNHLKEQLQIEENVCGNVCEFQKKDENCKNLKVFNESKKAGDDFIASKIKYCWRCENPSRYMCGGCRKARYCEESCQWKDWGGHKEYCLVKMNKIAFREFESMSPSIFK